MSTDTYGMKRRSGRPVLLAGLALALAGCGVEPLEEAETPGTQQQALTTLTAAEDAHVHESNATSNYGSSAALYVKNDAGTSRYAYLKFKLTGITGVTSARLRVHGSASASTTLQAFQTPDAWAESSLTWSNMPAVGSLVGGVALNTTARYYEIDVTAYVNAQAAGDGTVSFVLRETVGKYTTLVSSEGSANVPQLDVTPSGGGTTSCTNALSSTAAIQTALKNAAPGAILLLAPGSYTGDRSTSGDPGGQGLFYSGKSGTSASPIILKSCDPANPATLRGTAVNDGSYGLHLTGDHWQVRDLRVTTAQKGIMIDNGNRNLLSGVEVHNIGDEGVHFRDGSSYNTLEASRIYNTGRYQPQYGEGAYVGSDVSSNYEHVVIGNVIRTTVFDGGITAEHLDIKEGADGTLVEGCTFNGAGISGLNSADSFVDVKGVNTVVRNNRGFRQGNGNVLDAFQVRTHGTGYATGENNAFSGNIVDLDASPGYVVYATSATVGTTAQGDVRTGGGNLYNSNVNR